nr:regulator of nonsense transcripts 3B-like [Penaeus vannamei]
MTVKANEGSKRDHPKSYNDHSSKRSVDNKQNAKTKKEKTTAPLTKVVVRRLPPAMTEEEFLEVVSPLPDHDYFMFSFTDSSLGAHAYNRAYINFKNVDDVYTFRDRFDGYVFVDQKGDEYPAMVEFAPFQKIPKRSGGKKKDARCGTIDEDPDFLAFMESLTNPTPVTLPNLEAVLEEIQAYDRELKSNNGVMKVKTPLLEFIEQKKAEKLRNKEEKKEERRRKEFERKKAREEEKRKKKEGKEHHREMKKREDHKDSKDHRDDSCVKVLRPERLKDEHAPEGKQEKSRTERDKERAEREKEKQRRRDEDRQRQREREREKREKERMLRKEREREERIRRQEERMKLKEEETGRHKEDGKDDWTEDKPHVSKTEGTRSKRYSEGRRKEERERERKFKEQNDREKKAKDNADTEVKSQADEKDGKKVVVATKGQEEQVQSSEKCEEKKVAKMVDKQEDVERQVEKQPRKRREKDPRVERRIRNKDRPAMALYRPGQSRLSSGHSRSEKEDGGDTCSSSPSPVMLQGDSNVFFGQGSKDVPEEPRIQEDLNVVKNEVNGESNS